MQRRRELDVTPQIVCTLRYIKSWHWESSQPNALEREARSPQSTEKWSQPSDEERLRCGPRRPTIPAPGAIGFVSRRLDRVSVQLFLQAALPSNPMQLDCFGDRWGLEKNGQALGKREIWPEKGHLSFCSLFEKSPVTTLVSRKRVRGESQKVPPTHSSQ